jgi:Icc protein
MKIAHISDIHYSKSWMFLRDHFHRCLTMINEEQPDVVVITGDLTDYGLQAEFEGVLQALNQLTVPYFVVPGNHDARHEGYKKFEQFFGERFFARKHDGLTFIGIDSSQPDIDEGHIGREQLEWLGQHASPSSVVFLHHHLIPVPHTGRERNVLNDAGEVLKIMNENRVPLVMSGHKHVPWVWNLNGMAVSTAGTVSCERTGAFQSFNLIELDDRNKSIYTVNIATGEHIQRIVDKRSYDDI